MDKEKYEKPAMEVVVLKDDVILTSIASCPPIGIEDCNNTRIEVRKY